MVHYCVSNYRWLLYKRLLCLLPWLWFLREKYGLNMRARSIAKHLTSKAANIQNSNTQTPWMTSGIIVPVEGTQIQFEFEIKLCLADHSWWPALTSPLQSYSLGLWFVEAFTDAGKLSLEILSRDFLNVQDSSGDGFLCDVLHDSNKETVFIVIKYRSQHGKSKQVCVSFKKHFTERCVDAGWAGGWRAKSHLICRQDLWFFPSTVWIFHGKFLVSTCSLGPLTFPCPDCIRLCCWKDFH